MSDLNPEQLGAASPLPYAIDPSAEGFTSLATVTYQHMNEQLALGYLKWQVFQREHIDNSQEAITRNAELSLDRAEGDQPRQALVLGAGNCIDIPVEHLASIFDQVTLVDVDPLAMQRGTAQLPKTAQDKVTLLRADVTGVMAGLTDSLQQLAHTHYPNYGRFVESAAQHLATVDPTDAQPDLGESYDFVCSQTTLTQLGMIPSQAFLYGALAEGSYGVVQAASDAQTQPIQEAFDALSAKLQTTHLDYLKKLVSTSGVIHLADYYAEALPDGNFRPIVQKEAGGKLQREFVPLNERREWYWRPTVMKDILVVSNAITPRQA